MYERDPLLDDQYETSFLDSVAEYLTQKIDNQAEQTKLLEEQARVNAVRNSIFEKRIFEMEYDVIDFAFIPLISSRRTGFERAVIAFAYNNEDKNSAVVNASDMRGNNLISHEIPDCQVQNIMPTLHPNDLYLAVLCSNNLNLHLLQFSDEPHIDVKMSNDKSPYFRLANTRHINIPEKLRDLQKQNSTEEGIVIEKASSYLFKGNKYFLFVDSTGRVITVRGDLKVKNTFQLDNTNVTSLKRHNLSMLFSTENNLGFLKIFEEISDQVF